MDPNQFDRFTRSILGTWSRRGVGRALAGLTLSAAAPPLLSIANAGAKKKKRSKPSKGNLCSSNGSHCKKKGKTCNAGNCLQTPFTIQAHWVNPNTDHDTYMFVPNEPGAALPFPYLDYSCRSSDAGAGFVYPFAYVDKDATGPGDEVTTVAFLLDGKTEYWIELAGDSPVGDLTVTLRNKNGNVVRSWSSPENGSTQSGWHVFDIQGERKSVTSIDQPVSGPLASGAHASNTKVCA